MSNSSYLVVTDVDTLYPSFAEKTYSAKDQTIAAGTYCVPVFWFGLFRADDMRSQTFNVRGDTVTGFGPIAPVDQALEQLAKSVSAFEALFRGRGEVREYVEMLSYAVRSAGKSYVTIESEEIACLSDEEAFYQDVRTALTALNGEASEDDGLAALGRISELSAAAKFPSALCLLKDDPVTDEEIDVVSRLVGASWLRDVPWE